MKKIIQFGYRVHGNVPTQRGLPVVNCLTIPNPWRRGDNATDEQRKAKVAAHPEFVGLVERGVQLLAEHDVIAVGCQFGRHRSGAVAEEIARRTGATVELP